MTLRFQPGRMVGTPSALAALVDADQMPHDFLLRHLQGDWGDLSEEDRELNDRSLIDGGRLLSAYTLATGIRIWIVTESDRSTTTILIPNDY